MNDAPLTVTVPVSQLPVSGTARQRAENRDARGTQGETLSLKALAQRILERDSKWDTKRDRLSRTQAFDIGSIETVGPSSPALDADDLNERAALVEYGAGVPRQWAEGFAVLCTMALPAGFSPERWQRIVDAAGRSLDRWAANAAECGWTALDVFGADPDRPDRRFDCMGLLLLLDRCEIVGIDERGADLVCMPGETRQRFRRRPIPAHTVRLWDLVSVGAHPDAG